ALVEGALDDDALVEDEPPSVRRRLPLGYHPRYSSRSWFGTSRNGSRLSAGTSGLEPCPPRVARTTRWGPMQRRAGAAMATPTAGTLRPPIGIRGGVTSRQGPERRLPRRKPKARSQRGRFIRTVLQSARACTALRRRAGRHHRRGFAKRWSRARSWH